MFCTPSQFYTFLRKINTCATHRANYISTFVTGWRSLKFFFIFFQLLVSSFCCTIRSAFSTQYLFSYEEHQKVNRRIEKYWKMGTPIVRLHNKQKSPNLHLLLNLKKDDILQPPTSGCVSCGWSLHVHQTILVGQPAVHKAISMSVRKIV